MVDTGTPERPLAPGPGHIRVNIAVRPVRRRADRRSIRGVEIALDELSGRRLLLHVARHLVELDRKLDIIMATQADLDAAVASINAAVLTIQTETGELTTATAAILAEIAALQNANPALNLSDLNAAVATLTAASDALKAAADATEAIPPVV